MTDERRRSDEMRQVMERAAELGGRRALEGFVRDFSPHDPNTHDGRMQVRADWYHAHKVRRICETAKSHIMKTALGAIVVAALAVFWQSLKGTGKFIIPIGIVAGLGLWSFISFAG